MSKKSSKYPSNLTDIFDDDEETIMTEEDVEFDPRPIISALDEHRLCEIVSDNPPIRNKRARSLAEIARTFAEHYEVTVVDGILFAYDHERGCFEPLNRPEQLVDSFLPYRQADQLVKRDYEEVVERIKRLNHLQRTADDFNAVPLCINCLNGVLDTRQQPILLTPHKADAAFTYVVNAKFIPSWEDRPCPTFEEFCGSSLEGDPVKRQLLLEIIGYSCSDSTDGKCALFLKGSPDSGKSVLADFIRHLFDDALVSSVPLHKLADRFNKAELFGKKINICGEIKAKKLPDITIFKMVTGGDRILAEYKGRNPFSFSPRCKLLFSGNALPGTVEADSTAAFTNRLVVLLFNASIPKAQQDKGLLGKLLDERDAIFSLAIEAFQELQARNFVFTLPDDSKSFLSTFQHTENSIRSFVADCCTTNANARIFNRDLLAAYEHYCRANGLDPRPRPQLYDAIDALPGVKADRFRMDGENLRGRVGLSIMQ